MDQIVVKDLVNYEINTEVFTAVIHCISEIRQLKSLSKAACVVFKI